MTDGGNDHNGNGGSRAGQVLARMMEQARALGEVSHMLEKPLVTVEHAHPDFPGEARVVVALHDTHANCNALLAFMRQRYPDANIHTIDVQEEQEGDQHGER